MQDCVGVNDVLFTGGDCGWHEVVVIMTFWMLVMQVLAAKQAAAKTAKAAVSKADKRLKQLQAQSLEFL